MHDIERQDQVSFIQLRGRPYQQVLLDGGETVDCNLSLDRLASSSDYAAELPNKVSQASEYLSPLFDQGGYYTLDEKLKHGENLTFEEAFSLVAFVVSALNVPLRRIMADRIQNLGPHETHLLQAVGLLASLSTKESFQQLTPEEIAGMVAATIHLDTVARLHHPGQVLSFGGMGGDKGYPLGPLDLRRSKLFSLSTLAAVASAVIGSTHKHHSYPNTSKIAGQSAIEAYGARSDFHSLAAFEHVFREANLFMSSCHNTRTLHTLSHLLRGETINHVIGPLAFTLSADTPISGFIGVNEKVHPETIIEALAILSRTGYQLYKNSAVFCGTDLTALPDGILKPQSYYASRRDRQHVLIDEIAPPPYASLVAFAIGGESVGTFALYPQDFYLERELTDVSFDRLVIPNTAEQILHYNTEAITGRDEAKARYLAMTIGLGIFVRRYLGTQGALDPRGRRINPRYLQMATNEAYETLRSGRAQHKLEEYVLITKRYAGQ